MVDIEVNGIPAPFRMKLGDSGEAFFVQEVDLEDELDDENLATSPLPGSPRQLDFSNQLPETVLEEELPIANEVSISIEDEDESNGVSGTGSIINLESLARADDPKSRKRRKKRRKNQVMLHLLPRLIGSLLLFFAINESKSFHPW